MKTYIKDIAYYLPKGSENNEDLHRENPTWDPSSLEKTTGVSNRHIASEKETALDLAQKASLLLFSKNKDLRGKIDALIFCTQSEDYIMPANGCILHGMLNLNDEVLSFDFNHGCSGYIYGLMLAKSLIYSESARNILLVTSDTYSKYINKKDRSARSLFGDAAAVSWISNRAPGAQILDIKCNTDGKNYGKFIIPAGGCRIKKSSKTSAARPDLNGNLRSQEDIYMDGVGILAFVNSKIPTHIRTLLKQNNLDIKDIGLFVFHQASKIALDSLARLLNISNEKMYSNINKIGNTVSSSIPIALKDALSEKPLPAGSKIVLCGFGVGLSWASAIIKL
jgi:3-oxoacyl-[acyl-carrier-protein] synthase-3